MANGLVGRAQPVGGGAPAAEEGEDAPEEPAADPRFAAADEALARGDFAAARDEFDRLLQVNPNDAEAALGKAQAGLFARAADLDPGATLAAAAASAPITRGRHRAALRDAVACLAELDGAALPELRAESLRAALAALGRITGQVGVEAVLDAVFGEFCIGK